MLWIAESIISMAIFNSKPLVYQAGYTASAFSPGDSVLLNLLRCAAQTPVLVGCCSWHWGFTNATELNDRFVERNRWIWKPLVSQRGFSDTCSLNLARHWQVWWLEHGFSMDQTFLIGQALTLRLGLPLLLPNMTSLAASGRHLWGTYQKLCAHSPEKT